MNIYTCKDPQKVNQLFQNMICAENVETRLTLFKEIQTITSPADEEFTTKDVLIQLDNITHQTELWLVQLDEQAS